MNTEDTNFIRQMLYEKNSEQILNELYAIDDPEILYVFMYNYNWDNGFEIPKAILQKNNCALSTALSIFYSADGLRYLNGKDEKDDNLQKWPVFIRDLYNRIISGEFTRSNIKFIPPLNKVQIFKLKKIIEEKDYVFLEEIGENDLNLEF